MTTEISTQKRKDIENKIKMNYTKNKIKSLVTKIDTNDRINLSRFIILTNKRLKEIDNIKLQDLYANLLLQARVAIDYNKKIEEKSMNKNCNIDMEILLYTESQLIRDELRNAIDRITHPTKQDSQIYQDLFIYKSNIPITNKNNKKSPNIYEFMTTPLVCDMRSLYNDSKSSAIITDMGKIEDKPLVKEPIAQEMEL